MTTLALENRIRETAAKRFNAVDAVVVPHRDRGLEFGGELETWFGCSIKLANGGKCWADGDRERNYCK